MASAPPTPWGHGRVLTGSVQTLAAGPTASSSNGEIEVPVKTRKSVIEGAVRLTASGLAGDESASLDTAVSVYPWEHYPHWAEKLDLTLADGAFGENVTSIGLLETEVFVGDVFDWGQASVQVSQPRRLCFTGTPPVRRTWRTGFYLKVLRSGTVSRNDPLVLSDVDPVGLSVADVNCAMTEGPAAAGLTIERLRLAAHLLPPAWLNQLMESPPPLTRNHLPHDATG